MHFTRSRQGHLVGILGMLALFGVGCGSNNKSGSGNAYASFAWDISNIEHRSTLMTCDEVGATKVVVTLMDLAGNSISQDTVSCTGTNSNMEMSTSYVPAGDYTVGFDLYGDPHIYGNTPTLLDSFDLGDGYGNTAVVHLLPGLNDLRTSPAPFITQSFVVGWGLDFQGVLTTCSAMSAAGVDLDFSVDGGVTWVTSPFNCSTGAGTSYPIPYGETSVQWKLYLVDQTATDIASLAGATVGVPTSTNINLGTQYFELN
jgi:hypothetical protein